MPADLSHKERRHEILRLAKDGITVEEIVRQTGCVQSTVYRTLRMYKMHGVVTMPRSQRSPREANETSLSPDEPEDMLSPVDHGANAHEAETSQSFDDPAATFPSVSESPKTIEKQYKSDPGKEVLLKNEVKLLASVVGRLQTLTST
jgi:hypothetical protein